MSTVREIKEAVQKLSDEDRAKFRAWFAEFDAALWDRPIEDDVAAGRLDWLVNKPKFQESCHSERSEESGDPR